jgi:hypothetical protein
VRELLASGSTDPKNADYLEGCTQLMSILSNAADDKNSPIISLRNDEERLAFFFFAREFLPCVVKRLVFRQKKHANKLSEFVTVSDEAFTLLLLENNVARWNAMFLEGTKKSDDHMPTQKFQNAVSSEDKNGKDGYGFRAVRRYNEYYDDIERARRDIDTESLEKELMERMESLETRKKNHNLKGKRRRDGELNLIDEHGTPVRARCDLNELY